MQIRQKLEQCCRSFKDNPINLVSLTFKDSEMSARYKYQTRIVVYNRAKVYCIFLAIAVILTPYNL